MARGWVASASTRIALNKMDSMASTVFGSCCRAHGRARAGLFYQREVGETVRFPEEKQSRSAYLRKTTADSDPECARTVYRCVFRTALGISLQNSLYLLCNATSLYDKLKCPRSRKSIRQSSSDITLPRALTSPVRARSYLGTLSFRFRAQVYRLSFHFPRRLDRFNCRAVLHFLRSAINFSVAH